MALRRPNRRSGAPPHKAPPRAAGARRHQPRCCRLATLSLTPSVGHDGRGGGEMNLAGRRRNQAKRGARASRWSSARRPARAAAPTGKITAPLASRRRSGVRTDAAGRPWRRHGRNSAAALFTRRETCAPAASRQRAQERLRGQMNKRATSGGGPPPPVCAHFSRAHSTARLSLRAMHGIPCRSLPSAWVTAAISA